MKTLLLLDDDIHIHNAVSMLLDQNRYNLLVCTTTDQAIRAIDSGGSIDIVLLDIALSEEDSGLNFLHAAKKKGYGMPIIVITGISDPDIIIEAFRAGADDIIRKPYLHQLKNILHTATKQARRL